jgi:2,3-bisphosphoglycerate-independent phosphoglycerate mutase
MGSKKSKRTLVVGSEGTWRFQTGMVTAALLARGVPMNEAFAGSARLRESLRGRAEITTEELDEQIAEIAAEHTINHSEKPASKVQRSPALGRSRLLRFAITAGLDPADALSLTEEVETRLDSLAPEDVDEADTEALVSEVLRDRFGERAARRYQLTTSIRRSERPVVILIGGATGTGKSTLATELAFRLGISQVTSTDMVREAMRSVLSREVVPGLHDHSFRGMALGKDALSDPQERVLAGFRQQADQVAVGIRALVRRAGREATAMVIEGTHLRPPFRRYVPADVDAVVAGLVLAVTSAKKHRKRFPHRALKQPQRRPDAYLDSFQAVRWIHEDLLAEAETHDSVVVSNSDMDGSVDQIIDVLSRTLEFGTLATPPTERPPLDPRTLFIILDGLSDQPNAALGGLTPLAAADTPTLELLASVGGQGCIQTGTGRNELPETDEGLMALLGGPDQPTEPLRRGLLEAMGLGLRVPRDAVVFRGNLATLARSGELIDRRAGRIRAGTSDLLAALSNVPLSGGLRGAIWPAQEHRVVVMLRGPGLSEEVSDTDPGTMALDQRVQPCLALDASKAAERTAVALTELLALASRHLASHPLNARRSAQGLHPANCLITRGASSGHALAPAFMSPLDAAMVTACSTAQGVARAVGLQPVQGPGMTANVDTDIDAKFSAAAELFATRSFVVVHFKGTDIAAHDRRPLEKRDFVTRTDAALGRMLRANPTVSEGLRVVVSADHGTDSRTGDHLPDPVPLLVARWSAELDENEERATFDEDSASTGALGVLEPGDLSQLLWGEDA